MNERAGASFCNLTSWTQELFYHARRQRNSSRGIYLITQDMMTSSDGNIFRVTGPLCGELTGDRSIPRTKASDVELCCFLWSTSKWRLSKQSWEWWFETLPCSLWRHCYGYSALNTRLGKIRSYRLPITDILSWQNNIRVCFISMHTALLVASDD